jgi:hypothetical protein
MSVNADMHRLNDLLSDLSDAKKLYTEEVQEATDNFFEGGDGKIAAAEIQEAGEDLRLSVRAVTDLMLDLRHVTESPAVKSQIDDRLMTIPSFAFQEVPE